MRTSYSRRVADQCVLRTDCVQRVFHGTKIPRAVIDDRDHSNPFVDGSTRFNRASREHAYRIARAKHLKIASIL